MAQPVTGELIKDIYHLYNRDDQVLVENPLDYDFEFGVEGARYIVRAGDQAQMLGYMANLFVKNVVNELMQKDKKLVHLNNPAERQKYVDRIVKNHIPAIAPVAAATSTEPTVLSQRKGELAGASYGGNSELPPVKTDVTELTAAELEQRHPLDDGRGNKIKEDEEEAFSTLKEPTRADMMKEAASRRIPVENTDTKEILKQKLAG